MSYLTKDTSNFKLLNVTIIAVSNPKKFNFHFLLEYDIRDGRSALSLLCLLLPDAHRDTLESLVLFLRKIATNIKEEEISLIYMAFVEMIFRKSPGLVR